MREARHRTDRTMPDRPDHTASHSVILADRRPQSLAFGAPFGAVEIDPVAQPGSRAVMPLRVRHGPPRLDQVRQREHHNEAIGTASATFMNEAMRHPSCLSPRSREKFRARGGRRAWAVHSTGGHTLCRIEQRLQGHSNEASGRAIQIDDQH